MSRKTLNNFSEERLKDFVMPTDSLTGQHVPIRRNFVPYRDKHGQVLLAEIPLEYMPLYSFPTTVASDQSSASDVSKEDNDKHIVQEYVRRSQMQTGSKIKCILFTIIVSCILISIVLGAIFILLKCSNNTTKSCLV